MLDRKSSGKLENMMTIIRVFTYAPYENLRESFGEFESLCKFPEPLKKLHANSRKNVTVWKDRNTKKR